MHRSNQIVDNMRVGLVDWVMNEEMELMAGANIKGLLKRVEKASVGQNPEIDPAANHVDGESDQRAIEIAQLKRDLYSSDMPTRRAAEERLRQLGA